VQDPDAAQETLEVAAIIRNVLTLNDISFQLYDLRMIDTTITGTVNQLLVTWNVELTAHQSSDWTSLSAYVGSSAFVSSVTSAATALSGQHLMSFFEVGKELVVESIGMQNVPSPPPPPS
tara:strand:- start:377 stop:736 length:360 start_codon:yes stop_codon:yes gene_type:complete